MSLEDEIREFKKKSLSGASPEISAAMSKAAKALAESGIVNRALAKGDSLPSFTLPDLHGRLVTSEKLLAGGPLVVSFYRGSW